MSNLTKLTTDLDIIQGLVAEPNDVGGLTYMELQAKFDEASNLIKTYVNNTLTAEIDAKKLDMDGNFTGTLNGMPIVESSLGLSTTVAGHTTQLTHKADKTSLTTTNNNVAQNATDIISHTTQLAEVAQGISSTHKNDVDATTIIQDLLNTYTELFIPHGTFNVTGLNSGICKKIWGHGTLKSIGNAPILILNSSDVVVDGIGFIGQNDISKTLEIGVSISTKYYNNIKNCYFTKFLGKSGVYVTQTVGDHNTLTVSNCTFKDNNIGVECAEKGEFVNITNNCKFKGNKQAITISCGNVSVIGNNINNNIVGISLLAGSNDSHGIIANNNINHNTGYGLYIDGIGSGETISANHIYQSKIYIKNTILKPVRFLNNILDPMTFWGENCFLIQLVNNHFPNGYLINKSNFDMKYNGLLSTVSNINTTFTNALFNVLPLNFEGGWLSLGKPVATQNLIANEVNILNPELKYNSTPYNLIDDINIMWDVATKIGRKTNLSTRNTTISLHFLINKLSGDTIQNWRVQVQTDTGAVLGYANVVPRNDTVLDVSYMGELHLDANGTFKFAITPPPGVTSSINTGEFLIQVHNL